MQHLHPDIFKTECAKHNPSVHDYNKVRSFVHYLNHTKWQRYADLVHAPDKHQVHYSRDSQFKRICKNCVCNLLTVCRCLLSMKSQHLLPYLFQISLLIYAYWIQLKHTKFKLSKHYMEKLKLCVFCDVRSCTLVNS